MEELDQKLVAEKLERYRRLNQFAQLGKVLFVGSRPDGAVPHQELLLDMGRTYTVYEPGYWGIHHAAACQVAGRVDGIAGRMQETIYVKPTLGKG